MEWQVIVALVLIIPVIIIPVDFLWYIKIGGNHDLFKKAKEKRAVSEKELKAKTVESPAEVNNALD